MTTKSIFFQFVFWYFVETPAKILRAWKNYLKFNLEFFSVFLLVKTLFAPWKQYSWSYGRGFDFSRYLQTFFSNMITSVLGAVVRSILIVIGLGAESVVFVIGLALFLAWLVMPVLIILGLSFGFSLIS